MEIERHIDGDALVLSLRGKFDATWSGAVDEAVAAAIRDGRHRIALDLAGVDYISSAGLRVLLAHLKQLKAIGGELQLRNIQSTVAKVLELSGMRVLFSTQTMPPAKPVEKPSAFRTAGAQWEQHGMLDSVIVREIGGATPFDGSAGEFIAFAGQRFGIGVGAIAEGGGDAAARAGEFLAVAGCAAHLPPGDSNRADYVVSERELIPSACITSGLVAESLPGLLLRFEADDSVQRMGLGEILQAVIGAVDGPAAFVMVAETAGLVGATLRKPFSGAGDPFAFPGVREYLDFTAEHAFRDSVILAAGFVSRPGSRWDSRLRPATRGGDVLAHVHGAVFPYQPVRKGVIPLSETVRGLFDAGGPKNVLHLLLDGREPDGAGESEFFRGACWVAGMTTP